METGTWIMMAVVLGIVWGGFGLLLLLSMRAESRKSSSAGEDTE